jgi:methanogenic corrinoid protein MtbC1
MTTTGTALYNPVSLNREYLIGKLLERYAEKHPGTWKNLSLHHRVQVREEYLAIIQSLEESLATGSPAFLVHHACWVQSRFVSGHFPRKFFVSFLGIFKDVLARELPKDYRKKAVAFATKAISHLKTEPESAGTCPDTNISLSPVASSFLEFLLAGEQAGGRDVIDRILLEGTPVREIYTGIFQPVLKETGRLWQENRATIAQEHYVTGVVRQIMDQQHDRIITMGRKARKKKTVVAACVGEELHEIGIRMVADFFEMDGWNLYYIGANTPAGSILNTVKEQKADVVALSITMPSRLPELRYLVRSLRADKDTVHVKIIVGGYPFSIMPDLWKRIGADAVAAGAEDAVAVANRLTAVSHGTM